MDDATRAQLELIYRTIEYMISLDGQDRSMIVEMSQAMLADVLDSSVLRDNAEYMLAVHVLRYCTVLEAPEEAGARRMAADICTLGG